MPRGLYTPAEGRGRVCTDDDAVHSSGRVHRLRRVRAGVPRRRDLRECRRDARPPEGPHRGERDLPQRRAGHDRARGRDRQGARRRPCRHHGHSRDRASGGPRPLLTARRPAFSYQPIADGAMKLATWNVNGIRARQSQVLEWIAAERPDVVCLQEIKATTDQIPMFLCDIEGYWCYWHGGKGYSGVALHVSQAFSPERPAFDHPRFDYENRIVTVDLERTYWPLTV